MARTSVGGGDLCEAGFRRQKWQELMWGDADYHREKVAQLMGV